MPTGVHPIQPISGPCSGETMYPREWRIATPASLMRVEKAICPSFFDDFLGSRGQVGCYCSFPRGFFEPQSSRLQVQSPRRPKNDENMRKNNHMKNCLFNPHQRCGYSDLPFARKDTFLYCRVQKWVEGAGHRRTVTHVMFTYNICMYNILANGESLYPHL